MNQNFSYIAFFDVDLTLISVNSGKVLVKRAYAKGLMGAKDLARAIYLALIYKLKLKNPIRIIEEMALWLKGLPEDLLAKLTEEVFLISLLDAIRPEIYTEIKFHREHNARVVILSSALKQVCSLLADHLKMDDIISSELEVQDGLFTGRPVGRFCFGEEKVARLKAYCEKLNSPIENAYYYGDTISDLQILSTVGHQVCINPDNQLAKIARQKNWAVNRWK